MIRYLLLLQLLVQVLGSGQGSNSQDMKLFVYKRNTRSYYFTTDQDNAPGGQPVHGGNAIDGDISYLRAKRQPVGGFPKRMIVCRGNKNGNPFHLMWEESRGNCPLNSDYHFDFYASNNKDNGAVKIWYSVCQPSNGGAPYSRIVDRATSNGCLESDTTHTLGSFFAMKGKLMCVNREAPANGHVSGRHMEDGVRVTQIQYGCSTGYNRQGPQKVQCRKTGNWSRPLPTCQRVGCKLLSEPAHGFRVGDDITFGSEVSFNCSSGYELFGTQVTTCQANGQWTSPPPTCGAVVCNFLQVPAHGFRAGDDFTFGYEVSFSCSSGYELVGTEVTACQASGQWTSPPPTCRAVVCNFLRVPAHGFRAGDDFTFGSEVSFNCSSGYELVGTEYITCQANGHWTSPPPTCREITCPHLPQPEHGVLHGGTDRSLDSDVRFSCFTGYELQGSQSLQCEWNGNTAEWNGVPPQCIAIMCNRPVAPTNGGVLGTDFSYLASVTFNCEPGYTMLGSDIAICRTNGWDSQPPTCEVKNCGDLEAPEHGSRSGNSSTFGVVLSFSCDVGYSLQGPRTVLCEQEGRWTGRAPTCQAVACNPLGVPANGFRAGDYFTFGSEVSFSCYPGYELVGTDVTTCQANRQWISPQPTCRACEVGYYRMDGASGSCVHCPEFSNTTSTASFSPLHCMCEEDTQRTGDGGCEVIRCAELPALSNGSVVSTQGRRVKSTFSCDPGFILHGSRDRRCTAEGWTGTHPSCTACPENTYKKEEGSLACTPCPPNSLTNDRLGISIEACQCRPGFQQNEDMSCADIDECAANNGGCNQACENLVGSYQCDCTIPGWELLNDQKTCVRVHSCPEHTQQPGHGRLECRYVEEENGNTCFMKCDQNYFFVSGENNYITCGASTNYTWSHQLVNHTARLPSCKEEYFSDVQLPMSVNFTRGQSEGNSSLDEELLRLHLEQQFQHLDNSSTCPTCQVPEIAIVNTTTSEVQVNFNLYVANPRPDPILPNCNPICKSDDLRQMMRKVFLVLQAFERKVNQQPDVLAFQDGNMSLSVQNDSVSKGRPQIICEPGKVSTSQRLCVPCEPGYYPAARTDMTCSPCPQGTYQDESGQVLCKECPGGLTTADRGAYHQEQCVVSHET